MSGIDLWTLTLPVVLVGLFILCAVLVALSAAVLRHCGGAALVVRTARPGSTGRGWTVEEFGLGWSSPAGPVEWVRVRMTWPEAASWAAQTSSRPDVGRAWVDVPTSDGRVTCWLWESGLQTQRSEVAHV
ncbi:hypothetical protein AB0O28_39360 [Microbispora sp. NPDC088329]|uniref:hypothetical protein n=1 Tax=Microbispora sp. NPDC088329 TaxID=3154869 RepID=UPI00343CC36E